MVFCNRNADGIKNGNKQSHNPYFNRWFSAIYGKGIFRKSWKSHNPYFNRWFSAIKRVEKVKELKEEVTILILIDGFLQCRPTAMEIINKDCHNPYFNRWFSAIYTIRMWL